MYILGINAYHGDAAAAIVRDGKLIAAVEEERFNRIRHCAGFPTSAIKYCLRAAGISIAEVAHVGISRNPSANLHKKILFAAKQLGTQRTRGEGQRTEGQPPGALAKELPAGVGTPGFAAKAESDMEADNSAGSALSASRFALGTSSGDSNGFARQLAGRLRNTAKVRDLRNELARALAVPAKELRAQVHNIEHHRAHLASAFFVSPFEHAALLSVDGFGDFVSTMRAVGKGNSIRVLGQVEYPHSLGIVYTATTQFLGFPHYGDEGKVMGLAPYGEPRFIDQFREIISLEPKGKFRLNLDYFRHATAGVEMSWEDGSPKTGTIFSCEYTRTFGPPREPEAQLTDRESDIAASLQLRLEEVVFHVLNHLHVETGLSDLALAGGVAYNSVLNGKISRATPFQRVFVQPAAGDSGTALGVCYQIWNDLASVGGLRQRAAINGRRRRREIDPRRYVMDAPYTGPEFTPRQIRRELRASAVKFKTLSDDAVIAQAARDIVDGLIVGWFQGRMELGPRALGNRSILADPRRREIKEILNARIKKREPFRPFAPSILEQYVADYFEQSESSPAMLMVFPVKAHRRGEIPAVTHIDGSGRLQTVTRETNPRYYALIEKFYELTGVPMVLNTSFNENEPIVCTPRDALDCFLKTRMDVLYLGNFVVYKDEKR